MFTRKFPAILFFILTLGSIVSGNGQKLRISYDYASFVYDSTNSYVELYYSFDRNGLKFSDLNGKHMGGVLMDIALYRLPFDSLVRRSLIQIPVSVEDSSISYSTHNLVGLMAFVLLPGRYRIKVQAVDINDSTNSDSLNGTLDISRFSQTALSSSDIELCSMISSASQPPDSNQNEKSIFYKNTLNVIPNPSCIYGAGLPIIYYYVEIYNLLKAEHDTTFPADSFYVVDYRVIDSFGRVHKSSEKIKHKFANSAVEVGTINASNLKTGTYTFVFSVRDSGSNAYATTSKRFFVYNPGLGSPVSDSGGEAGASVMSSEFSGMTEAQIDREFQEARYIATSNEISQYNKLSGVESKRAFIYDFWKKRNSNPVSQVNTYRQIYMERVGYANAHFSVGRNEGWNTDRGRVYLLYGPPDEIDRHPNETDSRPYEIWYYNSIEGGVNFVFVDRTGFGDYTLVNSTKRGEIHDDDWQRYLTVGR
ncbi:MAG: GWxTD domain-containing protein [Candidatus Kryptoniota bacterium]